MKYKKMLPIQAKKYSDRLLSQICKVWANEVSSVKEVMMKKQLSTVKAIEKAINIAKCLILGDFLSAN